MIELPPALRQLPRTVATSFARLSPREKWLVGAFVATLALSAVYIGVIEPLTAGRRHMEQRIQNLGDEIAYLRSAGARVADLERALARVSKNEVTPKDFSLFAFVDKAASATVAPGAVAAMNPSRRRVRDGEEESLVEVRLSAVPLTEVVAFLRKLEEGTNPVFLRRVELKRRYDDRSRFDATVVAAMIERS